MAKHILINSKVLDCVMLSFYFHSSSIMFSFLPPSAEKNKGKKKSAALKLETLPKRISRLSIFSQLVDGNTPHDLTLRIQHLQNINTNSTLMGYLEDNSRFPNAQILKITIYNPFKCEKKNAFRALRFEQQDCLCSSIFSQLVLC